MSVTIKFDYTKAGRVSTLRYPSYSIPRVVSAAIIRYLPFGVVAPTLKSIVDEAVGGRAARAPVAIELLRDLIEAVILITLSIRTSGRAAVCAVDEVTRFRT